MLANQVPLGSLAILGEASVLANAQISALSFAFLVPRLLPAPQALIRTSRPEYLDTAQGNVVGTNSGNSVSRKKLLKSILKAKANSQEDVNHIAHLLHEGGSLDAYSVRCERIEKQRPTEDNEPPIIARRLGPLTWLSFLGCAMSIALLGLSIHEQDGMALLATLSLSGLSTLIGIGSRWSLVLKKRKSKRPVPKSDVVINYPNGSFLIIKCSEEVARELYWHPPRCEYQTRSPRIYRIISLSGTLILMLGVVCLGNSTLNLQLGFAVAYIILNAAYWVVAALPPKWHWDLSCYKREIVAYKDGEKNDTFTTSLWKAIAISGTTKWVRLAPIAPMTEQWDQWLAEAAQAIQRDHSSYDKAEKMTLPDWDPEEALSTILLEVPAEGV